MLNQNIFIFILFLLKGSLLTASELNIVDHGANGDGKTINTEVIQSVIDKVHTAGGGVVVVPSGDFLTGSLVLRSNVELRLEKKATLLGSTDPSHYMQLNRWKSLILAENADRIAITGKGTIDGQGTALALHIDSLFYEGLIDSTDYELDNKRPKVTVRPQIIEFVNCKYVEITDITIRNAASWVQTYKNCYKLTVRNITVDSDAYWNNDGIDIIDCIDVMIRGCDVNSSDDGICIKSYYSNADTITFCKNIVIKDCMVRSSASAIKFGTASYGGFKDIIIDNIRIHDTYRSAIALECYLNGTLENVQISNIKAQNTGNAIFIRSGKYHSDERVGLIKNVSIKNVKVNVPLRRPDEDYVFRGPALPFFHNVFPASITGVPGYPVKNVTLENIKINYPGNGHKGYANLPLHRLKDVPELPRAYPEFSMFGELPAWGFYVRHVEGLTMKDVKISIKKRDYRPALVFDDVKGLRIRGLEVKGDEKEKKFILNESEDVIVE